MNRIRWQILCLGSIVEQNDSKSRGPFNFFGLHSLFAFLVAISGDQIHYRTSSQ